MSRTKHHRNQKRRRCGLDFGARYKSNKGYGGGYGPQAKNAADIDRRQEDKRVVREELQNEET
ncbi:MAG: hypothetical protein GY941_26420 [Planctomycetes bacterium]|nr:hypothetical protein [Planctomycetota bacterium]